MVKNTSRRTAFDQMLRVWMHPDNVTLEECRLSCPHEESTTKCRARIYDGLEHEKCEFYCMACGAAYTVPNARCASEIRIQVMIDGASDPEEIIVRGSPVRDAPLLAQGWAYRFLIACENVKGVAGESMPKELKAARNVAAHARFYDWRTSTFKDKDDEILHVGDLPRLITWAEHWQGL